jgi:hypothetical protein
MFNSEVVTLGLIMIQQTPETGAIQATGVELRSAVRFPLVIPVRIEADGQLIDAMTENISATGVLFVVDQPLALQKQVRFTLKMPGEAMGTPVDVVVHCGGRVVRCTTSGGCTRAAAVIDEYYFSQ